jgi:multidrug resistance efflux pump
MTIANSKHDLLTAPKTKELISAPKPKQELKKESKNSQKPLSRLLVRAILFGAGAGLLAWGISLTLNRVTSVTAAKAFVNGKIITVTSPLSGQVQAKANLDSGMPVRTKQLLLKVNEPVAKSDSLQALKLELVADKAKLESVEAKIRELSHSGKVNQPNPTEQSTNQQSQEGETYKAQEVALTQLGSESGQTPEKVGVRLAEQNVKQAEIELKVAQGHAQVAHSKYEKYRFLANQGAMSTFSVEEVLHNWKVSREQIEGAKVKLETAKLDLAERRMSPSKALQSAVKEVSVKTNPEKTNTQELNPELAELRRRKTDLQINIEAKEKALTQIEKSSGNQKNYPILASSKGVLWEVLVQDGEQVNSGQPLLKQLNCQQLWVDAFVNIEDLKRIQIGSPAQVELYANNLKLDGRVKTIRSSLSGEPKLGQDVAVNPPDIKNQQLAQVRIELQNPQELSGRNQTAQFCQVGQVAKVNIGQENALFANLSPW